MMTCVGADGVGSGGVSRMSWDDVGSTSFGMDTANSRANRDDPIPRAGWGQSSRAGRLYTLSLRCSRAQRGHGGPGQQCLDTTAPAQVARLSRLKERSKQAKPRPVVVASRQEVEANQSRSPSNATVGQEGAKYWVGPYRWDGSATRMPVLATSEGNTRLAAPRSGEAQIVRAPAARWSIPRRWR